MDVIYSRACGVDVHKRFIVAVICFCDSVKPRYIRKRFLTFNNQLIRFRDWLKTTVRMYAWKVLVSIISLYTMHWKVLFPMSSLPIPNGLLIFSNWVLSDPALFLKRTFAFLGNLPDTSSSINDCISIS